jgi:hypothetical protein
LADVLPSYARVFSIKGEQIALPLAHLRTNVPDRRGSTRCFTRFFALLLGFDDGGARAIINLFVSLKTFYSYSSRLFARFFVLFFGFFSSFE